MVWLSFVHCFPSSTVGEISLDKFDPDSFAITPPAAPGLGFTARVPVKFRLGGEASSQRVLLQKVNEEWKVVWEQ